MGRAPARAAAEAALLPAAIGELLAAWDTHLGARGLAGATRAAYQGEIRRFMLFALGHLGGELSPMALARLTLADFRAWMAAERGRGRSARSAARALAAVRGFFDWLAEAREIDCQSIHALRSPKVAHGLPRPVGTDDAFAVLESVESAAAETWVGARDRAVLALLWGSGLRVSEALGLRWGAAPLGEAVRVTGKGGKARSVPVLPAVSAIIERYRALCPHAPVAGEALFLGVRGGPLDSHQVRLAMRRARAELGLPANATPHALRHAFATEMLAAGGDLRAVQELLGHARLSSTQVYTAVDRSRLLQVYEGAHPRARRGD